MILRILLALLLASLAAPLAAQTCSFSNNPQVAPDSRYQITTPDPVNHPSQDVVLDKYTGLEWKRCAEGQTGATCAGGSASTMIWSAALAAARGATWAGHADWRLPNIEELRSLVETGCYNPAINTTVFPSTPSSYFWSSTTYVPSASYAWDVHFSNGSLSTYNKNGNDHVRLVRGGQRLDSFTLDYFAGPNGSLSGDDHQSVPPGGNGTQVTAVPDPGYHFVNWSDGVTANPRTDTNVQGDISVTANFAINSYTVTFLDWDGAVLKTEPVDYGSGATAPADPTRTGYTFSGWDVPFNNITADLTVTAQYTINSYTVTFKDWDGTVLKSDPVNYGSGATAPADPSRTGYTFAGWDVPFNNITADLTVTAQYTINSYTVTFLDWDGAVLKTEPVDYGSGATAPPDPSRTGYTFANWNTAADGTGTAYAPGDTFPMPAADSTLYATWTINRYTLSFNSHGGSVVDPIEADFGETVTLPAAPTYPGYVFVHWNSAADGSGTAWAPGDFFTVGAQDEEFHAIWLEGVAVDLAALPNPSRKDDWVVFQVDVAGTVGAPPDGGVAVTASTGESCSSQEAESTSGNVATFACTARFTTLGPRDVTAQFSGSTTHADASSNPVELKIMRFADLSITADDGEGDVAVGDVLSYLLEVRNAGPDDAPGSQVLATVAPLLDGQNWTCSPVGSASCPAASGTGSIAETVDMPANSGLDFTLEGEITGTPKEILLDASVVPDAGAPNYVHDPVPGNNQAQDRDMVAHVFADGFEEEL